MDEVISLLENEIERLKEALETFRLTNGPNRILAMRWHVRTLDERQDALDELHKLLNARREGEQVGKIC